MLHKIQSILMVALVGCSQSLERTESMTRPQTIVFSESNPAGFSVIEQHPNGYFIRLASAERADVATIRAIADTFAGKFDRIDLCLDVAHERGDEYTSIIGYQVFDHEKDHIYSLKTVSK